MGEWFNSLTGVDMLFLSCALVGGVPQLVRFVMLFTGGDFGGDEGLDADFESMGGGDHFDADTSLRFLSLQGLTSFLMMFGLVGFALYRQSQVGVGWSLGGGVVAGLLSFYLIAKVFKVLAKLNHSGTTDIRQAVGAEGTVYLTIPENGSGQVTVQFANRQRQMDAVSSDNSRIPTDTRIRVEDVSGNTLIVKSIQ